MTGDDLKTLQACKRRWLELDGAPMPDNIASQPLDLVRKAVKWREKGITVAVPRQVEAAPEEEDSSLRFWDGESNN